MITKNLGPENSPMNPLTHFRKLQIIREIILHIVNREKSVFFTNKKMTEFEQLFSSEDFFNQLLQNLLPMISQAREFSSFDKANSPMSKYSKVSALGFNRLKFEEDVSFARDNGESPIGFSNRLVEMGP
jgi:hypothetical protein